MFDLYFKDLWKIFDLWFERSSYKVLAISNLLCYSFSLHFFGRKQSSIMSMTRSISSHHFWSFRKQQFSFVIRIFFQGEIFVWTICTRYDMKLKFELGNNPNEMMSVSSLINYVKQLLCNLQSRNQFLLNISKN